MTIVDRQPRWFPAIEAVGNRIQVIAQQSETYSVSQSGTPLRQKAVD
jgi:hypothetical protein